MLLRAAESHTTPNEAGKARQAQNWGGAYLRLIKPPTSNIKPLFFIMSFNDYDSKALERIADSLEEAFNPEEALIYTPLYRIAGALESIAKSMDSSFKPEWDD
jgi:hypothetical protein